MKVKIDRGLKIKLLQALKDGYLETKDLDNITDGGGKDINGVQLLFCPTPLTEKDIAEIKAIQNGEYENMNIDKIQIS